MHRAPEIAVLLPVFRNQEGLERSLRSLAAGDGDFEVLVIDDGSAPPLLLPQTNLRVCLLRLESNGGISLALNRGLEYVLERGHKYVARLDAGDTVSPDRLTRQAAFLEEHPGCLIVSSWVDFVDVDGRPMFRHKAPSCESALRRQMRFNNWLIHPAVMFRTSAVREIGLYSGVAPVSEDYEYFLRMMRHGSGAVIPDVLTRCEYNYGGITVSRRRAQQRERLRLQIRYFDRGSVTSYLGVLRTLLSLATPHWAIVGYKQRVRRVSTGGAA